METIINFLSNPGTFNNGMFDSYGYTYVLIVNTLIMLSLITFSLRIMIAGPDTIGEAIGISLFMLIIVIPLLGGLLWIGGYITWLILGIILIICIIYYFTDIIKWFKSLKPKKKIKPINKYKQNFINSL